MSSSAGLQMSQVLLRRGRCGSALTGGGGEYQKAPPPGPAPAHKAVSWERLEHGRLCSQGGALWPVRPLGRSHSAGLASLFWFSHTQPGGVPLVGGGLAQFALKWTGSHMTLGQSSNPAMARLQTWPRCATEAMPSIVLPQWSFLWRHPWLFVSPWPPPVLSCPRPRLLAIVGLWCRCSHCKRQS